ncbi:MAG: DUF4852 domain-containing protein, partial [Desulfobacterales bacterium]|nr:DUF4852 domain-containing protein [Desulfobacterales bacterium]
NKKEKFRVKASVKIGEYDFNKAEFPVVDTNYPWDVDSGGRLSFGYPHRFKISFTNHHSPQSIKIDKVEARAFLQKRKDDKGNVNREVPVILTFVLTKPKYQHYDHYDAKITDIKYVLEQ